MIKQDFHVIYIEDNPDDAYIIKYCLEKISATPKFTWFKDGESFFSNIDNEHEKLIRLDEEKYLILVDLNMPGFNGFDVVKEIRAHQNQIIRQVPVIIFSSSKREEDVAQSKNVGAQDYLVKAGSYKEIIETLQHIIDKYGNI